MPGVIQSPDIVHLCTHPSSHLRSSSSSSSSFSFAQAQGSRVLIFSQMTRALDILSDYLDLKVFKSICI